MTKTYFLSFLFLQLHLLDGKTLLLQKQFLISQLDLTSFIDFPFEQKCLQIALNTKHQPTHQSQRLSLVVASGNNIPVHLRSHESLQHRDISTEQEGQCQTFLIFAESIDIVKKIFKSDQFSRKQFFPFTKIYFHFDDRHNYTTDLESLSFAQRFLFENALFGYIFEYSDEGNVSFVRDVLTYNMTLTIAPSYTPKDLQHPFVDTNLVKNNFRISLFNCPPYIIYTDQADHKTLINGMDGLEFRFIQEVTKNWNKTFQFRDFSQVKMNPYGAILHDLSNQSSDLATCALWLIEDIYKHFDLSTFYTKQCVIFFVPKPIKLHEATAIYTPLATSVWLLFLLSSILSTVLLNGIAKIEKDVNGSSSVFTDLTSTVVETINTATSHSVVVFPTDQTAVKFLLTSWILLSLLMGISYTTIYASRLASPSYEKPIDTVRQILDHGLYICNAYFDESTIQPFLKSGNADYRQLGNRTIVFGENVEYRRRLFVERKCVIFEVRLTKNYVALLKMKDDLDLLPIFRLTKDCITTHFTGFAFQKYSPFTKLFNWHIRRYQEYGIMQKWHSDILQTPKPMRTVLEDYPEQNSLHRITMVNVSGAFFLLGVGLLFSLLAFVIERLKYRVPVTVLDCLV